MAKKQKLIWTALPKSADPAAKKLFISVHVAPRLATGGPDDTLADFTDWLDWPGTAKSFAVSFGGGAPQAAKVVTEPPASSKYWKALFTSTTFVRGRESVNVPVEPVRSYPVARTLEYIQERYTSLIKSTPTNPASITQLEGLFGDIAFAGPDGNGRRKSLEEQIDKSIKSQLHAYQFANGSAPGPIDMIALGRFFTRGKAKIVSPLEPPKIDFHQMLAAANSHPLLLRILGLVIDLEIDGFSFAKPLSTDIRVIPTWTSSLGAGSIDVTPRTQCLIEEELFVPTPADSGEYSRGQLRLGDPTRFNLVQVDPDGSGIKVLNFAANLAQSRLKPSDDTPTSSTVPALRGAGLSVARVDRGVQFAQSLASGGNLNKEVQSATSAGPHPFLSLEEVTRGWYIDVWDAHSGQWHSLSRRTGALKFTSLDEEVLVPPSDEAAVTPLPTQSADPSAPKDMYLQESLFFWKGWSLAAAQPGNQILANDEAGQPPPSPPPFPLQFAYQAAPGSLPRLRFGQEYRVRMRAADLAGNSIPLSLAAPPGDPNLVAAIHFERFEPVQSPVVVPRAPSTPGESVERLVIRSNYNADPTVDDERHIVPARTSQRMAEFHGSFDVISGGHSVLDANAYALIVSRESHTIPGVQDPNGPPGALYTDTITATPYLPDVLARGAAFQSLPGAKGVVTWDFTAGGGPGVWPNYKPFRVILIQPPAPHQLGPPGPPVKGSDATGPFLKVQLAKADTVQVRLSSTLLAGDLSLLGLWAWAGGAVPAVQAESGEVWMMTPFQTLTLVHAVRQPLRTPEFNKPGVLREVGQTFAQIGDVMTFSRKSTGKVEVYASWQEPVDEGPGQPTPFLRTIDHTLAFPVDLDRSFTGGPLDDLHLDLSEQHRFYDTKHRSITYSALATTRFAEYFTQSQTIAVGAVPFTATLSTLGLVPGSVNARLSPAGAPLTEEKDFTIDATAGKITFPTASAAANKTVEVTFLVPPITRETAPPPEGHGPKTLQIPSSARPPAPGVLYVVPTFKWSEPVGPKSTRLGGGLRVYMERPWFASGAGELLGVVLWPFVAGGAPDPPDALTPYVTDWGQDPLFLSASLPSRHPVASSFPLASQFGIARTLDELPGQLVNVAGHTVDPIANFDATRGLWFCDIDVDVGNAYTPFIRLALARYQPSSVDNSSGEVSLSRVVLADYMQLAPNRSASLVVKGQALRVTVIGASYFAIAGSQGPGQLRVTLQERNAAIGNELGWDEIQSVTVGGGTANDGTATWAAGLTLPAPRTPGKFQLVLEQFEVLPTDGGTTAPATEQRIAYTDIIPV